MGVPGLRKGRLGFLSSSWDTWHMHASAAMVTAERRAGCTIQVRCGLYDFSNPLLT